MLNEKSQRLVVLAVIVELLVISAFSWYPDPEPADIGRTAVSGILYWYLYDGRIWAKWLLGALCAAGALFAFYALFAIQATNTGLMLFLLLGVSYGLAAFILLSPVLLGGYFNKWWR